jgi:RNA polymerase sigma-70 factor (ECF subfamily)
MNESDQAGELERLHSASFSWALSCCRRNREEAEEVLQASYLKLLEGRARFDGRSSFKTFLFGVIRRTASEGRRRQALQALFFRTVLPPPIPEATEATDADARLHRLDAALAQLPRRQREVIELRLQHEMTLEEAASALAISVGSARVHYTRAKERLRRLLDEEGGA